MGDITLKTLDGATLKMGASACAAFTDRLNGAALQPGDAGFDEARRIWNAMVDRRPGLIVRARDVGDIVRTVNFARDNKALLSVRGGGHNIAGNAVSEGGIMLDLSQMRAVEVDAANRRARVNPGATLADVDKATQAHGLAVPLGINSTTGIAGLTLGGGFGWTTRKLGMTVDNLRSVDIVTADGAVRQASESKDPDLFWAVRGGGGNFGVATSFEFALHPLGPEVLSGLIVHPLDEAPKLLREYRRIADAAPDELTCWVVMRRAPPLPFIPQDWHGREVMIFAICYSGDMREGERAVAELRALGKPIADVVGPHPFVGWQAAFDPLLEPGARNYWKSHDFLSLSDGAIDAIVAAIRKLPDPECEVFIGHLGGAMSRVAVDATAYPQRKSHFLMNVHTRWRQPAQDKACIAWARDLFDATAPHSAGSVYVNFMPEDDSGRLAGAYGPNLERLAKIKAKYDPDNLFRFNQNIAPQVAARAARRA